MRFNKEKFDIFSGITPDTFTFSNASPEFSIVFVGPSRYVSSESPDISNLTSLLTAARRAIFYERMNISHTVNNVGPDILTISADSVASLTAAGLNAAPLTITSSPVLTNDALNEYKAAYDALVTAGNISPAIPYTKTFAEFLDEVNDIEVKSVVNNGVYSVVGMAQSFDPTVQVAQIPVGSIGYQGKTFVSIDSGSQVGVRLEKFLYNGGNLGKSLMKSSVYTNYLMGVTTGTVGTTDDVTQQILSVENSTDITDPYLVNLRSAIMKVPVGIGALYFDRQKQLCGSVYLEGCRIANLSTMLQTGAPTIMEDVDIIADRQVGIPEDEVYALLQLITG